MKKLTSVFLTILMVLSLVSTVYAAEKTNNGKGTSKKTEDVVTISPLPAEKTNNGKGKDKKAENAVTASPSPESAPSIIPADTVQGLTEQLKANHKNKEVRKLLFNQLKEVRKQNGDDSIPVIVNGQLVKVDVPPVIKNNRTLIPVRAVTNALGATVDWDRETNDVTVTKAVYNDEGISTEINVVIDLDTGKFYKDGSEIKFDVPAQVINNRTVVPIRFLAEIFGMKIDWDKDLDGVVVDEEKKVSPTATPDPTATPTPTATPSPSETPEATPTPGSTPST